MPRNRGLRQLKNFHKVANANLLIGHEVQKTEASSIGKPLEKQLHLGHCVDGRHHTSINHIYSRYHICFCVNEREIAPYVSLPPAPMTCHTLLNS